MEFKTTKCFDKLYKKNKQTQNVTRVSFNFLFLKLKYNKTSKMFNLNIPTTSLLGIDGSSLCTTPKTPEILNSLMAMTNPLDNYTFTPATTAQQQLQQQTNATTISQNGNHQVSVNTSSYIFSVSLKIRLILLEWCFWSTLFFET